LYDACKTISVTQLKEWGYLRQNHEGSGTITWREGEQVISSIHIQVNTRSGNLYLELSYQCNGEPISYRVQLVLKPSNLGKGALWFFVCPRTGKHCRKLYLVNHYFLHRTAFNGVLYVKQTYSKHWQEQRRKMDVLLNHEDILTAIDKPYFKAEYKGKPTKRYLKLLNLLSPSVLNTLPCAAFCLFSGYPVLMLFALFLENNFCRFVFQFLYFCNSQNWLC